MSKAMGRLLSPMSLEPILDSEAIQGLRALSPNDGGAFVRELIEIFLTETDPRMANLSAALASHDAAESVRLAHSIKGSCGNFGAVRLQSIALRIEQLAKNDQVAQAAPLWPEIEAAYAATRTALQDVLRDLK